MGVMSFLRRSGGPAATAPPAEPNLRPEVLERFRQLSPRERQELLRDAAEGATGSLSFDPARDWEAERDAFIEAELLGYYKGLRAAVRSERARPR
jgi:hypothetical protein